jgi:hypothetical protein
MICAICKQPLVTDDDKNRRQYRVRATGKIIPQGYHKGTTCETEHDAVKTGLDKVSEE